MREDVEVKSEYIGKKENEANIYRECSNWSILANETVLQDITSDWSEGHTYLCAVLPTSKSILM